MLFIFRIADCRAEWQSQSYSTMGTNIYVEVYHPSADVRSRAIKAVLDEMERINSTYSTYIQSSELSQLNLRAAKLAKLALQDSESPNEGVLVSQELFELLRLSQQISALTDGAFDVTYASVGYLYSYPDQQRPNEKQIESLLDAVDYQHITLDQDNLHVSFKHPNVKIDLGGIAKGFAVDNSIDLLKNLGIANALVTAGGDTRLLGDRLGKPWVVGIRDPRDKEKNAVLMPLADSAMSTSGDYERYFEEDGIRYHHIITPQTGKSARQVQSVSILGPQSVYNDALSTAVFVLGLERGIGLINGLPEFEAIVMDNNRRLHYSSGLGQ